MVLICIYLATNDIKMLNIFFTFTWHLCVFFHKIFQSFAISIGSVLLNFENSYICWLQFFQVCDLQFSFLHNLCVVLHSPNNVFWRLEVLNVHEVQFMIFSFMDHIFSIIFKNLYITQVHKYFLLHFILKYI